MIGSRHTTHARDALVLTVLTVSIGAAACRREQRAAIDSAVDSGTAAVRTALAVVDVDMGRQIDADRKVTDKTDGFAATDTIYASVHTSGTATSNPVMARWTFEDGSVVDETTQNVTT